MQYNEFLQLSMALNQDFCVAVHGAESCHVCNRPVFNLVYSVTGRGTGFRIF